MNDLLRNFHSFHLDFIQKFKSIQHNGIPLVVLMEMKKVCNKLKLDLEFEKETFKEHLNIQVNQLNEIHKHYDAVIGPLLDVKKKNPPIDGKLLICDFVLYADSFIQYLDPSQTFVLNNANSNQFIGKYAVDNSKKKSELVQNAKQIFENFKSHPIYSNPGFQRTVLSAIPVLVDQVTKIELFLKEVPVSCVIIGTTERAFTRSLTLVAGKKGIPSICFQHALTALEIPVFATRNAVFGKYEVEWYLSYGVAGHRIEITGHPRHDRIFMGPHLSKPDFQQNLGLNPQKKYMVVATHPDSDISLVTSLIQNLLKNPSIEIIIKPHPHEFAFNRHQRYDPLLSRYPNVKLTNMDVYFLLHNADLVIVTGNSTFGLEGMLFNKPVLFLKTKHGGMLDIYDDMGRYVSSDVNTIAEMAIQLLPEQSALRNDYNNHRNEFVLRRYPKKCAVLEILELVFQLTGKQFINPNNKPHI